MNKVRCQGCRSYKERTGMRHSGLGWVCNNDDCLGAARDRRAPAIVFRSAEGRSRVTDSKAATRSAERALKRLKQKMDQPSDETRLAVKTRDRFRCRKCGTGAATQLHHINYRSEGVDHQPHNLVLLCNQCHMVVHSDKRRWKPLLLAYVWIVYTEGTRPTLKMVEARVQRELPC